MMAKQNANDGPEDELEDMRRYFKVFDADNSGFVDADEFVHLMTTLGETLSEEEVRDMIAGVDADGDGKLNIEEFITLMLKDEDE